MPLKESSPPRLSFYSKVRLVGRTACFCYFSVVWLLVTFNGSGIIQDLKDSGFLFALGMLALGSGMFSLVTPRKEKKGHESAHPAPTEHSVRDQGTNDSTIGGHRTE